MPIDKSEAKQEIKKSFEYYLRHPLAIYFCYALLGLVLDVIIPIDIFPSFLQNYVGIFIILIGFIPMQWAIKTIYREGLTWHPLDRNMFFIATGPYRYTRNPIYLSYCIFYVGLFVFLNNIIGILLIIPLVMTLNKGVIARNEATLSEMFGEAYQDYKLKVPRWL